MSRYIDVEPILAMCDDPEVSEPYGIHGVVLERMMREAPIVGIVHCKECKWYNCKACFRDDGANNGRKPEDFCSYGERKL